MIILLCISLSLFADLEYGKYQFNEGLYDEAIMEFETVIKLAPTSNDAQEAWHYIGRSYLEKKRPIRAEEAFQSVLDGYPKSNFEDKNLYYLATVQTSNTKYEEAISNFKKLISKYPLSEFTKKALKQYVESFYLQGEFQLAILQGKRIAISYPENVLIPEIYLIIAKAYYNENMAKEGDEYLQKIMEEYASYNAKWKAVKVKIERVEAESGTEEAANKMAQLLEGDIPRLFEEELRLQLAEYYIELVNYASALEQLNLVIGKFNNSADLDLFITKQVFCLVKQGKYKQITADFPSNKKVFKQSDLKGNYELLVAEAFIELEQFETANAKLSDILDYSDDESLAYQGGYLQALLQEKTGKLRLATASYKTLLTSPFADRDKLQMNLGDIYFENLRNFTLAKKYYQQIAMNSNNERLVAKAKFKSALCDERLADYDSAVAELEQIEVEKIEDTFLANKIIRKLNYLKNYRQKNFEAAFNNLLSTIYSYLENDDKTILKSSISGILAEDLKEQEKSVQLLQNADSGILAYRKAKILLELADKYRFEMNSVKSAESLNEAKNIMAKISTQSWKAELAVRVKLMETRQVNSAVITMMESYLETNPTGEAANEFRLLGAEYYWKKDAVIAANWAEALQNDQAVEDKQYYLTKLKLAEYYYELDNDLKALENYLIAEQEISLNNPLEYFHYAVVLNENGDVEKAADKLAFLINNTDSFAGFDNIILYFTKILRSLDRYPEAITYQLQIPHERRSNEFLEQLSADYLVLDDKENAKEMLMYIPEKNERILAKLANLQFETKAYEIAKYSFGKLIGMNDQELDYYWKLGQIHYLNEEYLLAAENYKIIVDKLGDRLASYEHIRKLAKENVVALYRINNRPKAEKLQESYKKVLTEADENEIMLSRGVYYIENDKQRAEKVFSKLLKKESLDTDVMIAAYFWRGVVKMKQKETEAAETDFITVANSINKEFSNQAHLKLGTLNFSKENYQKALDHYYTVIEKDEDGKLAFDAAQNFALVCKTIEEWQKAVAAYEIILTRWGHEGLKGKTVFDIAFCHYRDKRYQHSIEMFERVLTILDDKEAEAEAQYWIGESYYGMEEYEKAISELLKVGYNYSEFTQWAASAELRAGEAYMEMKNPTKARQIYQRVKNKYGAYSQWGTAAQKRLDEM